MNISTFLTLYLISVPLFFIIDMFWLGVVAKSFYRSRLDHLMGDINWPAALIFYFIFLVGLTYFAIYPGHQSGAIMSGVMLGALFGFFTYATYDLTNMATLRDWPLSITIVDMLWGTVLGASVTGATLFIYSLFS